MFTLEVPTRLILMTSREVRDIDLEVSLLLKCQSVIIYTTTTSDENTR